LVVQIEGAIMAGTFDSRTTRWLLWEPKDLDDQGWAEMGTAIAAFHEEAKHIESDAESRLAKAGKDVKRIHTTFGVLMFESPEHPDSPEEEVDAPADRSDG